MRIFKQKGDWSSLSKEEWGEAAHVVYRRAATLRQSIPFTTNDKTRGDAEKHAKYLERTAALLAGFAGVPIDMKAHDAQEG